VLIIATSYLVLFSRPLSEMPTSAALFVAMYLASNIVLAMLLPRFPSEYAFDMTVVMLDTFAVCGDVPQRAHRTARVGGRRGGPD
jgi:hypothetical protein